MSSDGRQRRQTQWLIWAIPGVIFALGMVLTVWASNTFQRQAESAWADNAEQVAQWLSGALLGWMEKSYASLSGVAAMHENSDFVTEDEFFNAFDAIEARATAFFLDGIAVAVHPPGSNDSTDWEIEHTSDPFGLLSPEGVIEYADIFEATIEAALARPGRIVLGPAVAEESDRNVSLLALITDTPRGEIAILGQIDYDAVLDGLERVHLPAGVGISLSGRFPNAEDRDPEQPITSLAISDEILSLTTRTISAETELVTRWHFSRAFDGGPDETLGEATLWAGVSLTSLICGIIVILLLRNREISKRVAERTAELSQRERELSKQKAILETTLETIDLGVSMFDTDRRLMAFNTRYSEIFRHANDDIAIGTSLQQLYALNYGDQAEPEGDADALHAFEPIHRERELPDGRFLDVRGNPIPGGEGFVTTFDDITERKSAERALQDAYGQIASSIDYASNIQRSLLVPHDTLEQLIGEHFVIWEPRDVVGGDLYWARRWGDGVLVALGDCTGHGVPGAFMTLIATAALDRAVKNLEPGALGEVIGLVHRHIQKTLGQDSEDALSDDGMDIGAVYIPDAGDDVIFCGANFTLFGRSADGFTQTRGDKRGVGYRGTGLDHTFTEHRIRRADHDSFYMASDGIFDQTGGERGHGFGKRRFMDVLLAANGQSLAETGAALMKEFRAYQGDAPRRDDVSSIGFAIRKTAGKAT